MKFEPISGTRRANHRRNGTPAAPGLVETFEHRTLLTVPNILTPSGTVTTATPEITWDSVPNAVSYDVWISDMDTRKALLIENGVGTTSYTPGSELNQGRIRIWVRANLNDSTSTDWSVPVDIIVRVQPLITGPLNNLEPSTPTKIDDTTPEITWSAAPGSHSFELFLSNRTALTSTTYRIANLTPRKDANGDPIPDGKGDVLRDEIRSFEIPVELKLGQYQVFIRTTDDGGRTTDWSPLYAFEVAPKVEITRPTGPTFQDPPMLEWKPVNGATHYDLWVDGPGQPQLYRQRYLTTTRFQIPTALRAGNYRFWVRAINVTSGRPEVRGLWSEPSTFSRLARPVITGPTGVDSNVPNVITVTETRPTIEWTAIDKAVRYDVWVDRTQTPTRYLLASSSTNQYTFEADIQPGNYFVWVQAFSPTGQSTEWSLPYKFTATGGAPIILSPSNSSTTNVRPTFTWTPVANAASYDIWVAYVGVDFDYILDSGITETSYTPGSDMAVGAYRVWVRAVTSDGTALRWSPVVNFTVASSESVDESVSPDEQLAILVSLPTRRSEETADQAQVETQPANETSPLVDAADISEMKPEVELFVPSTASGNVGDEPMELELINKLATLCQNGEWWADEAISR